MSNETERRRAALSTDQIHQFHDEGYLGPFELCSPEEMATIRERIEAEVMPTDGLSNAGWTQSRHLDQTVVWDLCSHPAITDRMSDLYGPDLVLWRSNFFPKHPGGAEIPWHQDKNYWPIEPPLNVSAWLAIDDVTVENSCVQLIPGSHRGTVPHIEAEEEMEFVEKADPAHYDESDAVNMELEPGEFFLFTERLLHHSEPNTSDKRRLGISIRVTLPFVHVDKDDLFPDHQNLVLTGEDWQGINDVGQPPTDDT